MRKKNKLTKNLIFWCVFFALAAIVVMFGIFKNQPIFSEGINFYESPKKIDLELKIDIEEIKEKMNDMTLEEVEKTIREIEKEIKRLESKLN